MDFSSTLIVILRYRAILYDIGRYSPISAIPTLGLRRLLLRSPTHPTFPSPFPPTTLLLHPHPLFVPKPPLPAPPAPQRGPAQEATSPLFRGRPLRGRRRRARPGPLRAEGSGATRRDPGRAPATGETQPGP